MMKSICTIIWTGLFAVASGSGCGANPAGEEEPIAEGMGAIVASVPVVPPDVQCIEIQTTDYRVGAVRKDVTPGQAASFRLAPLSPGFLSVYGTAYSVPCAYAYGYYDY